MNFFDNLKKDSVDSGYRVCATKMSTGIKKALIKAMIDKGADNEKIKTISSVLESEFGDAIISILLGYGLLYIPKINQDSRTERLAKEFRTNGMSSAGNTLLDIAIEYFFMPINSTMEQLPDVPKFRVEINEEENNIKEEDNEEEYEEELPKKKKRMTFDNASEYLKHHNN
jgi:hypothetical protein